MPTDHVDSPLSTPDAQAWDGGPAPGCPAPDAPLAGGWLCERFGAGFVLLHLGGPLPDCGVPVVELPAGSVAAARYGGLAGSVVLVRPDAIVAARWHRFDAQAVQAALARAQGRPHG